MRAVLMSLVVIVGTVVAALGLMAGMYAMVGILPIVGFVVLAVAYAVLSPQSDRQRAKGARERFVQQVTGGEPKS